MLSTDSPRSFRPSLETLEARDQPSAFLLQQLPQAFAQLNQQFVDAAKNAQTQLKQAFDTLANARDNPGTASPESVAQAFGKGAAAFQQLKDISLLFTNLVQQEQNVIKVLAFTPFADNIDKVFLLNPVFSQFVFTPLQQQVDTVNGIRNDPTVNAEVTTDFTINENDNNGLNDIHFGTIGALTF